MNSVTRPVILATVLAFLCGCASVDFDMPKTVSTAPTDTADTYLGKQLAGIADEHPDQSGFYPLSDGIDALSVRLLMAARAERSIDAQYYLIKRDIVGSTFIHALLRAADRGVHVRLLVDDIFTSGYDAGMAGLVTHPNFEIRIFNPFARRSARFMDGITSFSRINRRMHNKSFTVDNQVTLIGGRNIADEYFGAREDAKFADLDVLAIGPIVHDVSAMFDEYWNHERAAPIAAFAKMPDDPAAELERVRAALEQARKEIMETKYAAAVRDKVLDYIETDTNPFIWAPYTLAVDSPDKSFKSKAKDAASITTPLIESLRSAEKEMVVISPYFVPLKTGIAAFTEVQNRGIQVTIITNSLAANNQSSVHGGYAPSRKPLLKAGVKIFEVRADANVLGSELVAASGAKATLHTKAFLVDRKEVFIGSFNFDPRSAKINTELGVIIRSPELAERLAAEVDEALPKQTYEVFLNEKGQLRWRSLEDGEEVIYKKEPQTSWWQRFKAGFMRMLPIRGQL
ncbi:MAG: phospholipase D family protein [Gammaproteobacteria bacterium]|nr:MAG: phospholipase D family protein [Gammaproteobacteria bacterium]RLA37502.1 MAG: phospholipase D family protein [Gammaproteobacteria bacterium]